MELIHNDNFLWFVIGYGMVILILGAFYSKKVSSSDDFILAGRSLGPVVLMGTLLATWVGSGTVTGGPNSLAYSHGLWPAIGYAIPSLIGITVLLLISAKIRNYGKYTVSEILEIKYGPVAKVIAMVIIVLAFVGIVSYQYQGLGFILHVSTGVSVETGTIIGAVLIIFLATIGGLMAVAPTDTLSALVIFIGLIIAVPVVLGNIGGFDQLAASVDAESLNLFGNLNFLQVLGFYVPVLFLLLGDQNMYQRISASGSDKSTKFGISGWIVGMIIFTPLVATLAFAAKYYFPDLDPGMALISTSLVLPTAVGGLLIAAVTSFIVTTGNSYLLSSATNITYDIYGRYINPNASDKQKLVFTRMLIPVLGLIAYLLTTYFPTVLAVQMYSYTVYGAGITPALLGVFLWKRVTKQAGIASMLAGVITTLILELSNNPFGVNSSLISIPVAIVVLIVVTLLTSKKENAIDFRKDDLVANK
ncbi:sodium:solute symporter family protein [Ornithinibacillus sp. L9]|uniref:Sodium:solute symporter family protein n=1 Tax=Ornithinibacillus caprae TaxID=2678566 RepID=A0A6N8FI52_9BACI|nr:sodium:solute symporter family protein [Ornithinibacillus caprae]MUK87429.1 sodium:solute symporter family protein [Ornithinibacillus caprae]